MNKLNPERIGLRFAAGILALSLPAAAAQLLAQEADVKQVEDNRSASAESPAAAPPESPAEEAQPAADARTGDAPGAASRPTAEGEATEQNR